MKSKRDMCDREEGVIQRKRPGGLNLFELAISILIISITSVAVASSFYTAYNQLTRQRWRKTANQLLKAEAEFWMGRVHSQFPSPYELQHRIPNPQNPIVLDSRTPQGRNVTVNLYLDGIRNIDKFETEANPDYYEITVVAEYTEPPLDFFGHSRPVKLQLIVPFIPSTI
jgi:hypothetical protein